MASRFASRALLPSWRAANAAALVPPVCNKLLHKGMLSVMGVGGPNARTDFHLERGSEFFWQQEGELQLPIVERGERRLVRVRAGEIFLLPPNIPHSPQRSADSFGIVVERERRAGERCHSNALSAAQPTCCLLRLWLAERLRLRHAYRRRIRRAALVHGL